MRNHLKKSLYALVIAGVSAAWAGSYEDFFRALKRDDPRTVATLLQRGFDPNTPNPDGVDALYLALQDESVQVAGVLIDWPKTKIDLRNPAGESPLMIAALRGQTELVRKLIARGADVNKTGWTPLHYAATSGRVDIIRILLEAHAYIDAESPNGTTPLMMAAQYGTPESVKLLLDEGADPTLKNQRGLTALDFARRGSRPDAIALISDAVRARQPRGTW